MQGVTGLRRAVRLAEDASVDHLAVGDHVSFYTGAGFDGLVAAATVLAASERLDTNTGVYLLPLRHPVLVARQLADLALLAPGRLLFGVGVGGEDPPRGLLLRRRPEDAGAPHGRVHADRPRPLGR